MQNFIKNNLNLILIILIIASISSFLLTINLPLIGEEGVYTNAALEMMHAKQYKFATLYGNTYPRPPLYNWLIIFLTKWLGVQHIVLSARIITLLATSFTAIALFYFSKKLILKNNSFALLTVALFLSGDLLFKRGWLAYSDPSFALFVFCGVAWLLLGAINNNIKYLFLANLSIFLGFLCKTISCYLFYITAYLILLALTEHKKFLLNKSVIFLHCGFALLLLWVLYAVYPHVLNDLIYNITAPKLAVTTSNTTKIINFIAWPGLIWLAFLPGSLIISYYFKIFSYKKLNGIIKLILLITIINLAPYWFSNTNKLRYLLPLYPWFAIIFGYFIWQNQIIKPAINLLVITVIIKYITAIFWFPYEYNIKFGDAHKIAFDILEQTKNNALYINDPSAPGLRIAGTINQTIWPKKPLTNPPDNIKHNYFLLTDTNIATVKNNIILIKTYYLKKSKVYLLYFTF